MRSCGSPRAVRNSTGVLSPRSRIVRQTVNPSTCGSITSSTTREHCELSQPVERRAPVADRIDFVAFGAQVLDDARSEMRVVLDDEHRCS